MERRYKSEPVAKTRDRCFAIFFSEYQHRIDSISVAECCAAVLKWQRRYEKGFSGPALPIENMSYISDGIPEIAEDSYRVHQYARCVSGTKKYLYEYVGGMGLLLIHSLHFNNSYFVYTRMLRF